LDYHLQFADPAISKPKYEQNFLNKKLIADTTQKINRLTPTLRRPATGKNSYL
jgi:hypothetical protein